MNSPARRYIYLHVLYGGKKGVAERGGGRVERERERALALVSSPSLLQIDDYVGISPLAAAMKSEVQEQIKEGCGLVWESYKLEGFVQKFSDTIFNFQEKVDDVLSYTDKIDGLVCSMETCEYKTKTFKVILEQIQKLIDDLNLRSYSNLSAWVKHLDNKVCVMPRRYLCFCIHISTGGGNESKL
jgi:hypothetical protein